MRQPRVSLTMACMAAMLSPSDVGQVVVTPASNARSTMSARSSSNCLWYGWAWVSMNMNVEMLKTKMCGDRAKVGSRAGHRTGGRVLVLWVGRETACPPLLLHRRHRAHQPVLRCLKEQLPGSRRCTRGEGRLRRPGASTRMWTHVHELGEDLTPDPAPDGGLRPGGRPAATTCARRASSGRSGSGAHAFRKLNIEKWLLVNLRIDRMPQVHIVDRYLEAVAPGREERWDGARAAHPARPGRWIIHASCGAPVRYTAVAIGAAHATKRLRSIKLIDLVQAISRTGGSLMVGPDGKPWPRASQTPSGEQVYDATGFTTCWATPR